MSKKTVLGDSRTKVDPMLLEAIANREKDRSKFLESAFSNVKPAVRSSTSVSPKAKIAKNVLPSPSKPLVQDISQGEIEYRLDRAMAESEMVKKSMMRGVRFEAKPNASDNDLWSERFVAQNNGQVFDYGLPQINTSPASSLAVENKPIRISSAMRSDGSTPLDNMSSPGDNMLSGMKYNANPNADLRDSYGGKNGLANHLRTTEQSGSRKEDIKNVKSVLGDEMSSKILNSQREAVDPSNDFIIPQTIVPSTNKELKGANAAGLYTRHGDDASILVRNDNRRDRRVVGLHEQSHSRHLKDGSISNKGKAWEENPEEISAVVSSVKQRALRENKGLFKNPLKLDNDIDNIIDNSPSGDADNFGRIRQAIYNKYGVEKGKSVLRSLFKVIAKNDNKEKETNLA